MMQLLDCRIMHVYREGNSVADALAKVACDPTVRRVFHNTKDLPYKARGAVLVDKLGLPSFRHMS